MHRMVMWLILCILNILFNDVLLEQDAQDVQDGDAADPG